MLHTAISDGIHKTFDLYDKSRYIFNISWYQGYFLQNPSAQNTKFQQVLLKGKALQINEMQNAYTDAMPVFNKVLKPQFAYSKEQGMPSVVYVDDTLLGGDTFEECQDNVSSTFTSLVDLCFYIHPKKSLFTPT